MIYQPSKYHSNSFTHFLQLHSTISNNNSSAEHTANLDDQNNEKLDLTDNNSSSNTSLEVVNDSVGSKSFTIAAILGLKKNSVCSVNHLGLNSRQNQDLENNVCMNDYSTEFSNILNLTAHSKFFNKFENDAGCLQTSQSDPASLQMDQCLYENNASNSSYQEHLQKQLNQDFSSQNILNPNNFHRSSSDGQHNPMLHSLQQQNANILNKALQHRDRNRLGESVTLFYEFLSVNLFY